jgi:uncharacterized membrane protein
MLGHDGDAFLYLCVTGGVASLTLNLALIKSQSVVLGLGTVFCSVVLSCWALDTYA